MKLSFTPFYNDRIAQNLKPTKADPDVAKTGVSLGAEFKKASIVLSGYNVDLTGNSSEQYVDINTRVILVSEEKQQDGSAAPFSLAIGGSLSHQFGKKNPPSWGLSGDISFPVAEAVRFSASGQFSSDSKYTKYGVSLSATISASF